MPSFMVLVGMFDIKHRFHYIISQGFGSLINSRFHFTVSSSLPLSLSYRLLASRYLAYLELCNLHLFRPRLILPGI